MEIAELMLTNVQAAHVQMMPYVPTGEQSTALPARAEMAMMDSFATSI
jgi:hypothetical protein